MIYLLAKYALLFLLVAISGFVFGTWATRRKYIDVSESYEDMRKAANRSDAALWDKLWGRLDLIPGPEQVDLTDVSKRLDSLASAISNLPKPEKTSLEPIATRMDELNKRVGAIPIPFSPKVVDLEPITNKLVNLEDKIDALPPPQEPKPVNLGPVSEHLEKVDQAIRNMPAPAPQLAPDLSPVQAELASLREEVKRMPVIETHQAVDLAPIDRRLDVIETEMRALGRRLSATPENHDTAPRRKSNEPRILSAALYGKKDDLRLISGVGPKLERLLNKNGVYYFWQVADWSKKDIDIMDERLDTFKGRIGRDDWVSQAKQLRRSDGVAKRPEMT